MFYYFRKAKLIIPVPIPKKVSGPSCRTGQKMYLYLNKTYKTSAVTLLKHVMRRKIDKAFPMAKKV